MTVRFEVSILLDEEQVALEGARRGLSLDRAREAVLADCECRLFDIIRHRDGVARAGVTLTTETTTSPGGSGLFSKP
jgi:hypothetical protein